MNRRNFLKNIFYGGVGLFGVCTVSVFGEYADMPGFGSEYEIGRTKNSISTVVAGIVGQKLYNNSEIDLQIQKHFFPDARVIGYTTQKSIDTKVNLWFTSARFKAKEENGLLVGEVEKSEFNWNVRQDEKIKNMYHIARFGPKFDGKLVMNVLNGKIYGEYIRSGAHFDWNVKGVYDKKGNVNIEIDGPVSFGIILNGKIKEI